MVVCKRDKDVELRFYRVKYTRCFRVKWPYLKYEFKTRGWKEFSISESCARKCFVQEILISEVVGLYERITWR